jgi:hypothetical protein
MSRSHVYDTIGATYSVTRRTEPRIAAQLWAALAAPCGCSTVCGCHLRQQRIHLHAQARDALEQVQRVVAVDQHGGPPSPAQLLMIALR